MRVVGALGLAALTAALGAKGWGSWSGFLGHPARAGAMVVTVAANVAAALSNFSFSRGRRESPDSRWFPIIGVGVLGFLAAWLMPYMDRRELWVIDGDAARYIGLALLAIGATLRIWPMFVLGRRFSPFVAIQEDHELVTHGLYGHIRHPSYLGGLVAFPGWALVFRSALGLVLFGPLLWATVDRMNDEENLLASEFGDAYAAYRRRTWRLVPRVY
jgi:protein-S-isoprenylcysteine O-methyltransferase Ste14